MQWRFVVLTGGLISALCGPVSVQAGPDDWAEGTPGQEDGATRDYYNRRGELPWRHPEGDWRDADGVQQGTNPFAVATTNRQSSVVEWDVTELVRAWVAGTIPPKGILLRNTRETGTANFYSREADEADQRPKLILKINGETRPLEASADTCLDRSTYRGQGSSTILRVAGEMPALLRFDVRGVGDLDEIDQAILQLTATRIYSGDEIGVFACDQGEEVEPTDPLLGLATQYPGDRGIEKHPEVLFATGFESPDWKTEWTHAGGEVDTVAAHPEAKFEPLQGKACRAYLAEGALTAMNMTYHFRRELGSEPEEIYFRYYLRFGDDWQQTIQGGKMPGISGTYGRAGWGGRKVNGRDGWSARGSFGMTFPEGNPLAGKQPLGWYCYHADMEGNYGSIWTWTEGYRGYVDNNRWFCVEQYVKLNTLGEAGEPGSHDGILRAWIDGRPAFEKTDLRFRDVDTLKIEQIWMNVYHGGTRPSPRDQHLYVDNVVVARKYIGPFSEGE